MVLAVSSSPTVPLRESTVQDRPDSDRREEPDVRTRGRLRGASSDNIEDDVGVIRDSDRPPPGVPGKRIITLADKQNGTVIVIGFFDTEDDLRQHDAALNDMEPERPMGRRAAVHLCEVMLERSAPG